MEQLVCGMFALSSWQGYRLKYPWGQFCSNPRVITQNISDNTVMHVGFLCIEFSDLKYNIDMTRFSAEISVRAFMDFEVSESMKKIILKLAKICQGQDKIL